MIRETLAFFAIYSLVVASITGTVWLRSMVERILGFILLSGLALCVAGALF